MKKILLIFLVLLASCDTPRVLTVADRQVYFNEEAVIAYEFFSEVYKNDTTTTKPIMFRKEN